MSWPDLYSEFTLAERARADAAAHQEAQEAARREYDAWADWAAADVLDKVCAAARHRADEFQRFTGHQVQVQYPSHAPIERAGEMRMLFLSLRLGLAQVDVYSHRQSGSPPALHLIVVRTGRAAAAATTSRPPARQLTSQQGAVILPLAGGGYCLRRERHPAAAPTDVDQVLLQTFQLLVQAYRK